ncbi:MAG: zinc-dependent peptidase [Rubripirellula sp.]
MLVTPESNQANQRFALAISLVAALALAGLGFASPGWWFAIPLCFGIYHFLRRTTVRRLNVIAAPFPDAWEETLLTYVAFFRVLNDEQKERFRSLVKVFLDEVPITGIRTDVDDATSALVAASAVIPVFGFDDWEYSGLGEVLIYPTAFGENYQVDDGTGDKSDHNILGMIGTNHLSGIMILSKADLFAGFSNPEDKRNVGIHEFSHLVDKADGSVDGIPAGIPGATVEPWIRWVGEELKSTKSRGHHINDYAYTNEAEYFAVLSEYFFEAPDILQKKNPELYQMLESIYRQKTKSFLSSTGRRPKRIGRNAPCPCGSGEKFKRCCRRKSKRRL